MSVGTRNVPAGILVHIPVNQPRKARKLSAPIFHQAKSAEEACLSPPPAFGTKGGDDSKKV